MILAKETLDRFSPISRSLEHISVIPAVDSFNIICSSIELKKNKFLLKLYLKFKKSIDDVPINQWYQI